MKTPKYYFVFDVESIGLHGEGFAVAGGVYINGAAQHEFRFCCPQEECEGEEENRKWVKENVPIMEITHRTPALVREAFWNEWMNAKERYKDDLVMAGECIWPVEAGFVARCIYAKPERNWMGPYPFHEIASIMLAAGMDPMAKYERTPSEMPAHEPLADARQSARLLSEALAKIGYSRPTPTAKEGE